MFASTRALLDRLCASVLNPAQPRRRASRAIAPVVGEVCESRLLLAANVDLDGSTTLDYEVGSGFVSVVPDLTYTSNSPTTPTFYTFVTTTGAGAGESLRVENQGVGGGQVGVSGSDLLYEGVDIGDVYVYAIGSETAIDLYYTGTQPDSVIQAVHRAVQYQNTNANPTGTPSVTFTTYVSTGFFMSESDTLVSNITFSQPPEPVLSNLGSRVTYVENANPLLVWDGLTLTDGDTTDWTGATATVSLRNGGGADRLSIRSVGLGPGDVFVSGTIIAEGGSLVATFTGDGTSTLQISFTAAASTAAVQNVLRSVQFDTPSDNPSTQNRTVAITLRDPDNHPASAAKTLRVIAVNDDPTLFGLGASPTFVEGQSPVIVAPDAGVTDVDSANFDGGQLTVKIITGVSTANRLAIRNEGSGANQVGVSGSNITFGGVTVGTFTGGEGRTPIVITWNANALPRIARQVVRNITFENVSTNPSSADVTVQFIGTDGDGGRTARVDQIVHVTPVGNPLAIVNAGDLNYLLGSTSPVRLTPSAGVSDPDGANLDGAVLQVQFTSHGQTSDLLSLRNGGSTAGQVGLSGADVTYGGTTIGVLSGAGTSNEGLTVTFNGSATLASVGAVLRSVLYRSTSATPDTSTRGVTYSFTDGDLLASTPVVVAINFVV